MFGRREVRVEMKGRQEREGGAGRIRWRRGEWRLPTRSLSELYGEKRLGTDTYDDCTTSDDELKCEVG